MILITGGARSGKSTLAEQITHKIVEQKQGNALYIATSLIFDDEMALRVEKHKQMRPSHWHVYEGHRNLGQIITEKSPSYSAIMLECITTMLTNLIFDEAGDVAEDELDFEELERTLQHQIEQLIVASQKSDCEVIIVTNELGLGMVPEHRFARHFRDIAGRANQRLAQQADEVHFVVSGIGIKIK